MAALLASVPWTAISNILLVAEEATDSMEQPAQQEKYNYSPETDYIISIAAIKPS